MVGGCSAETGGKLANLRGLSNAQVRRYHAENYRPTNTLVVLTGTADEVEFVAALAQVDERIRSKPAPPPAPRPWGGAVPPMDLRVPGVLTSAGAEGVPRALCLPAWVGGV
jgi:predicted Zn-dependent peptidase